MNNETNPSPIDSLSSKESVRLLILCTGNSCRSQMAEGFLRSFDLRIEAFSAGTLPSARIHPNAVRVMKEVGIDVSLHFPKSVDRFIGQSFDFVITVCDHAKETCPVFIGKIGQHLHIGFEDPAKAQGTEEEILNVFRRVRDEIRDKFQSWYQRSISISH